MTYNTKAQSPTWKHYDLDEIEAVGGTNSETNAGTYYRNFRTFRKYVFPNGLKDYAAPWTINKAANSVVLSETSGEVKIKFTRTFTVSRLGDGKISVTSSDESIAKVSLSGTTVTITGVSVGDCTITVKVEEGTNYLAASKTYSVKSRKTQIQIPTITNTNLTFNDGWQSPTVTNAPNSSIVTRTGDFSKKNYSANQYSFTYTIRDTDAYEWTNGSTSPLTYTWRINQAKFAAPAQSGTLTYTGSAQTPTWNFGTTSLISVTGVPQTDAGTYPATFKLSTSQNEYGVENAIWWDGSTSDKTANFTIGKATVTKPTASSTSLPFAKKWQCPTWYNYNASIMTQSGSDTEYDAGTYVTTFSLDDKANYMWSDGTTADVRISWSITRLVLTAPSAPSTSLAYTGAAQEPAWQNFDSSTMEVSGDDAQIGPGNYSKTFAVQFPNNYVFSNGKTSFTIRWSIAAKSFTITQTRNNNFNYNWLNRQGETDDREVLYYTVPSDYNGSISNTEIILETKNNDYYGSDSVSVMSAYCQYNRSTGKYVLYARPISRMPTNYVNTATSGSIKVRVTFSADGGYLEKSVESSFNYRVSFYNQES